MILLFSMGGFGLLGEQLSDSADRGESPHHTHGLKAPRPTHLVSCSVYCGFTTDMSGMHVYENVLVLIDWTWKTPREPVAVGYKTMWESPWHS